MATLRSINWQIAKMQYELFGKSLEEISEELDVPITVVRIKAEECNWRAGSNSPSTTSLPSACATSLQPVSGPDSPAGPLAPLGDELETLTRVKQSALFQPYVMAESMILYKLIDAIQLVEPDALDADRKLKNLTSILTSLGASNGFVKSVEAQGGDGRITVQILNNVGS